MRQRRLPPCLAAAVLTAAVVALLLCTSTPGALLFAWTSSRPPPPPSPGPARPEWGPARPPSFAYWISGTRNDSRRALRLLRAVYHPRNRYLLHLDAAAGRDEREALAAAVRADPAWRAFRNVDVVGDAYAVHRAGGASALAAALHGAAVLLRVGKHWDWFITLSAEDYPLVTQDDLLYAFSSVPRDLNFVDHTSDLGWKEHERFEKLIVDPSLYMDTNTKPFRGTGTRPMPDAFTIFTGSPWVILSRNFTEHCVHGGWDDNLPRKLLLYFANTPYSTESYFQTLICNSPEFRNTTVNGDLRYFVWADPPGLDPLVLDESRLGSMVGSGAAFARRFEEDAPVLRRIDEELLNRSAAGQVLVADGVWCPEVLRTGRTGRRGLGAVDSCFLEWAGDVNAVRPGRAGERLRRHVSWMIQTRGCR